MRTIHITRTLSRERVKERESGSNNSPIQTPHQLHHFPFFSIFLQKWLEHHRLCPWLRWRWESQQKILWEETSIWWNCACPCMVLEWAKDLLENLGNTINPVLILLFLELWSREWYVVIFFLLFIFRYLLLFKCFDWIP